MFTTGQHMILKLDTRLFGKFILSEKLCCVREVVATTRYKFGIKKILRPDEYYVAIFCATNAKYIRITA